MDIQAPRVHRRARIEIIPLIDVIFFLLATFVMVSLSMVQQRGIAVNLPGAATGAPPERAEHAVITVTESDAFFFDKQPVDLAGLVVRLRELAEKTEPRVSIRGDTRAHLGAVVRVLNEARKLGIPEVAIETQPEP